jgi:hypothetical protein
MRQIQTRLVFIAAALFIILLPASANAVCDRECNGCCCRTSPIIRFCVDVTSDCSGLYGGACVRNVKRKHSSLGVEKKTCNTEISTCIN